MRRVGLQFRVLTRPLARPISCQTHFWLCNVSYLPRVWAGLAAAATATITIAVIIQLQVPSLGSRHGSSMSIPKFKLHQGYPTSYMPEQPISERQRSRLLQEHVLNTPQTGLVQLVWHSPKMGGQHSETKTCYHENNDGCTTGCYFW